MNCELVRSALAGLQTCTDTAHGARVRTTCLYPSFEVVYVFVRKHGDGFVVSDLGEGVAVAMAHGRDKEDLERLFSRTADSFGVVFDGGVFRVQVETADWLESALLAVANATATACQRAVEADRKSAERNYTDEVFNRVRFAKPDAQVIRNYAVAGQSGAKYSIDVAAIDHGGAAYFDLVSPHRNSISAKFTAFSDIGRTDNQSNIAVHTEPLAPEDKILLQRVALVTSINSFDQVLKSKQYRVLN